MCSGYQGKNDDIRAIYGAGNYFRSPEYKKLEMLSHTRHSQGQSRKKDHVTKFHEYVPSIDDTFTKPSSLGERPGFQKRKQNGEAPDLIVDRFAICAGDSTDAAESGNNIASTKPFVSFGDPLESILQEYKFHKLSLLPKVISKSHGKCRKMW